MKKMIILLLSILGIVVAAVAFDKAVEKKEKVMQQVWFEVTKITPTGGDIPSNYHVDAISLTPPPGGTNPNGCTQENPSGTYCYVQLEFDEGEDPEIALDQTLEDAMADLQATQSGQARNPSLP